MKTDAMQFFTGGNEMQPRRMDCARGRDIKGDSAGFATERSRCADTVPFKKVLDEVTAGNVAAQRITKNTMAKRETSDVDRSASNERVRDNSADVAGKEDSDPYTATPEVMTDGTTAASVSADGQADVVNPADDSEVLMIDDDLAASAEQIVREALKDISEVLGLSIFKGLSELSLREVSGDTKEQFSEIVFILKKMIQGFELGRATGVAIETPNTMVDGANIDAVTDILRTSTFKIEVACNVLGIAESVQKQVAIKMELNGAAGIIQATDPLTITMASQHTERLFGGLFTETPKSAELAALIGQVKKLLAENGGEPPLVTVDNKEGVTPAKLDVQQFDAQVYRALLKIDKKDNVGLENNEAALGNGKTELPKTVQSGVVLAQNLAADTVQGSDTMPVPDMKSGMPQPILGGIESRISGTLLKMADETIMDHITGKLQMVIRSGLSDVRIHLRPESLGEVTMRIRMEGGVVLGKIEVQNQQVKEIMERNLPMLKDALAQQNLNTGSFEITINSGHGRQSGGSLQSPWHEGETAEGSLNNQGKEEENDTSGKEQPPGSETGRRFGSNSVEYFA